MRAKNKIVSGYMQEYQFLKKHGKLYLKCLEKEFAINHMTVKSVQLLDRRDSPSLCSSLLRGFMLSRLFGFLGVIVGTSTAKKSYIYIVRVTFYNDKVGVAEIDKKKYDTLIYELFGIV